ncbi:MAG TPA: hypothetical protein VJ770_02900 [Stellaceae bacterium]|nr:hypothetical protein [Stellaceae bacterium]
MRIPFAACRTGLLVLLAAFLVWASPPRPGFAETAGPPAGYARIWIYRYDEPYVSLATPYVRFNGRIAGVSQPGGVFYRDVPPGEYHVTVDSEGQDVYQFVTVAVVPGQQVYIQVQVSSSWYCGGGGGDRGGGAWCRPTFYTRLQLPQIGAAAVAMLLSRGGAAVAG